MTSAGEISVHVTIDEEQVKEAARLAARLFRSEYASAIIAEDVEEDGEVESHATGAALPFPEFDIDRASIGQFTVSADDEPVDVTEEPPVGSQVTDKDGNVMGRHEDGWRLWLDGLGVWDVYRESWEDLLRRLGYTPRPATDADRKRVGLPADTAREHIEPAPYCPEGRPDLDSLIASAHPEVRRHIEAVHESVRVLTRKCAKAEADVERLTRERDEARDALGVLVKRQTDDQSKIERLTCERDFQTARADDLGIRVQKAEAEVQRLTYLLGSHADGSQCTCTEINPGAEGISPPEWEQDPWCPTHPDMNVILTEVKRLRDGIDVIRSEARRGARIAVVMSERRLLQAMHLYLSGLLDPKPPADFSTLLDETEGETDDPA